MNQSFTPEAEEHLRRAIHARPNDWHLRHRVAEMLFRSGREEEAAALYAEGPGFWEDRDLVFQLLELGEAHSPQVNLPILQSWLNSHPDDLEGHLLIASAYKAAGKQNEADTHRLVAQTLSPTPYRKFGVVHESTAPSVEEEVLPEMVAPASIASLENNFSTPEDEGIMESEASTQSPRPIQLKKLESKPSLSSSISLPPPPPPSLEMLEATWHTQPAQADQVAPLEVGLASYELPTLHGRKSKKNHTATVGAIATAVIVHVLILLLLGVLVIVLPENTPPEITAHVGAPDAPIAEPQQKITPQTSPQVSTSAASLPSVSMITSNTMSTIAVPSVEVSNPSNAMTAGFGVNLSGVGFSNSSSNMSGGATFFGVQSKGATVLVIDISGSMVMGGREYGRIEKEAIRALKSMPKNAQFNVILFARDAIPFKPKKLVTADDKSIPECIQWLQDHSPELRDKKRETKDMDWSQYRNGIHSGTFASKAFDAAFEMKPSEIIYLSDGEPTGEFFPSDLLGQANLAGKDAAGRVHELIRLLQKRQKSPIKVNTISYRAGGNAEAFMDQIAKENSGKFKNLR